MKTWLVLVLGFLSVFPALAADYGKRVTYEKGKPLIFPDCELTFKGERRVTSPVFKPGFLYYDFTATAHSAKKDLSWSSGTGEIAPLYFEVGGRKFVLELKHSEAYKGWLKPDELVLWPQAMFEARPKS